jgi:hypothetical protein
MEWSIISSFTWSMSPEFPTSSDELQTDFGKFYIGSPNQQSDENLCKMGFLNIWLEEYGGIRLKDKISGELLELFANTK